MVQAIRSARGYLSRAVQLTQRLGRSPESGWGSDPNSVAALTAFMPPGLDAATLAPPREQQDAYPPEPHPIHRYRAIWLSDIHLGTPGCQATYLLDFLKHNESEQLYLVGDIIDGWQLRRAGTGRRATTTWCRSCCARRARAPR